MKRSAPPLQFFAAAAAFDASAMSSRSPFGRGRKQWGRGFSNRPNNEGRSQQFVSGDSHFRSVREANLGLLNGPQPTPNDQGQHYRPQFRQPPQFDHNQGQYHRVPPPQFYQNRGQYHRVPPPSSQNQGFRPPNQFRPRPSKPLDYRNWEYAELTPPPSCERFIILSYNILADYLAINHRSKLYYHIPRHILDWKWRKRNILFELGLWSADIMCFQEVDRFEELEEELKLRGYSGVYQRRTGNAIDGCAVFWRETRFKLLHKESIVFSEIGLRDNVAQLCVLELMRENYTSDVASPSTSSTSSNKIVVCNTHVLYNPKRGDIKLGQVRALLDRAHVLSKMWNNAPLVLCGDFNCTPKSPLYNFISEQKLDLSGMDRDKLSGQASAEIRSSRPIDSRYNANFRPSIQSPHSSAQAPSVDVSLDDSVPGVESLHHKGEDTPSSSNRFQLQKTKNMAEVSDVTSTDAHSGHVERKIDISLDVVDSCKDGDGLNNFILVDKSTECQTTCNDENKFPVNLINYDVLKSTRSATSISEKASLSYDEVEQREEAKFSNEHSQQSLSNVNVEKVATKFANLELSLEVSSVDGTELVSPEPNVDEESTSKQVDASCTNMSRQELECLTVEVGTTSEDQSSFLSALHSINEVFPPDLAPREGLEVVDSPKEFSSGPIVNQLHSRSDEFEDESSLGLDTETIDVERAAHDPSLWTPSEIGTATGKEDSTLVEHPLKLKSTYAEVKDNSGTRDQNGEPMVTSYNRCFLGTVDYIWCSEDLQTVRVLAPIPKHAMQWTPGFPTKKWGSDHIALASELAFAKNASRDDPKVQ